MPLWKFEEELLPYYQELSRIHAKLDLLREQPMENKARENELIALQGRLHEVENTMVDNKFVPGGWTEYGGHIPGGQAILVTLMNRCYKLVEHIQRLGSDIDPVLFSITYRLEDLVANLASLRDSYKAGFPIDPIELHIFQEQVDSIDSLRKDGKFFNANGRVPQGQAAVIDLLEQAYDLIHECVIEPDVNETSGLIQGASEALNAIVEQIESAENALSRGIQRYTVPTFTTVYETISNGMSFTRNSVKNPREAAHKGLSYLRNLLGSSFSYANKIAAELEPVDESLEQTYAELWAIRLTLKDIRNKRNKIYVEHKSEVAKGALSEEDARELHEFNETYVNELGAITAELHKIDRSRVDGKFLNAKGETPSGQLALSSLLNESYCLAIEMMDETCI